MFKNFLIAILFLSASFILMSCSDMPGSKPEIDKFEWLTGNRVDSALLFFESWTMKGDSMLIGNGYQSDAGDTIFSETLTIEKYNGKWAYIVNSGEDVTRFILVNKPGDSLVFDNPENEFPKRITYIKKNKGLIAVSIENPGETEKITRFSFVPVK